MEVVSILVSKDDMGRKKDQSLCAICKYLRSCSTKVAEVRVRDHKLRLACVWQWLNFKHEAYAIRVLVLRCARGVVIRWIN